MVDRDFYENIKKGTTTIGIICSDGVAMGADSRATMDTFISSSEAIKVEEKVMLLMPKLAYCPGAVCGSVE